MNLLVHDNHDNLARGIAQRLEGRVASLQADGLTPTVVLTGGTIAMSAYQYVAVESADWSNVDFYFGDERFVPSDSPDRNIGQAREAFLDRVGAAPERIFAMDSSDRGLNPEEAAAAYAMDLPDRPFDLVLLGVGPDGHVASLFPRFPQLHEKWRRCVDVEESPKPPPTRISMSFQTLNNADSVWFLVSGSDKAEAVQRAVADIGSIEETPARGVRGRRETLWLIDEDAASLEAGLS